MSCFSWLPCLPRRGDSPPRTSAYVYTGTGAATWAALDKSGYAKFGSPVCGDAVTDEQLKKLNDKGALPVEALVALGLAAPRGGGAGVGLGKAGPASMYTPADMTDEEKRFQHWLSQAEPEAVLEPELPICDPHHHLWDRERRAIGKPAGSADELSQGFINFFGEMSPEYNQRFMFDELLAAMRSGHNVVSTVFAQCGRFYSVDSDPNFGPVGETAVVRGVQAQFESGLYTNEFGSSLRGCAAGFGEVNFMAPPHVVGAVLHAHKMAMPGFAGVRQCTFWHPSPEVGWDSGPDRPVEWTLYEMPEFRASFPLLEEFGFSFDHCGLHTALRGLIGLARDFPRVTIICDHCGMPTMIGPFADKRDAVWEQWKADVAELATCPNVYMKVGGMTMPFPGFGWERRPAPPSSEELAAELGPWYRYCIETFGPYRCMFESNFPPDNACTTYRTLWNAFKRIAADYSPDAKAALFHDTAARVYKIGHARPAIGVHGQL